MFCPQSFHLQPTGTPGTYYLQTTSSQGLPLSLANNSTVTLTTGSSPSSHEHIILHSLSVSFDTPSSVLSCVSVAHRSPCAFSLLRRTASAPATASSSRQSPPTPPPQTLSTNHSWRWKQRDGARTTASKPRVSWRARTASSRKLRSQ